MMSDCGNVDFHSQFYMRLVFRPLPNCGGHDPCVSPHAGNGDVSYIRNDRP